MKYKVLWGYSHHGNLTTKGQIVTAGVEIESPEQAAALVAKGLIEAVSETKAAAPKENKAKAKK